MTQDKNLLSEKEKDIVINSIKEGKTIPKEYLYKLSKDDEDVFLFWNGRNEEVTNAVLPFHSIEHIDEPRKEKIVKVALIMDTEFLIMHINLGIIRVRVKIETQM